jgi:hypothetical protein
VVEAEVRRVFVGRIKYPFIARVGRIKGVSSGSEVEVENKD